MTVRLLRFWQYIPLRRYCCLLCLADYYNQWCILPCAQHHVVYDIFTIVQCNQHSPWLTYMWAYCAVYRIHEVIIPVVRLLLRELVVRTHLLHSCIFVRHSYLLIRIYVLPVLKHGPRSLMCVQVYRWDRTMHNICNHIYIYCYTLPANLFEQVRVWAYALGPERWWTVPVKGEVWGNSGGSPSWYWRANRSLYIGIGAKD